MLGEFHGQRIPWTENPMDSGAWQTTVHGVTRVGHDLVTKPTPLKKKKSEIDKPINLIK